MFQVCLCCDAGIENDLVVDVTNSPPPQFSSLLFSSVLNESDARCAQLRCAHMLGHKK